MSVTATYKDGVFLPTGKTEGLTAGVVYTVFSPDELCEIREMSGWLKLAEKSFDFWDNDEDAVYDSL